MKSSDLPTSQAIAKAVAEDLLRVAKSEGGDAVPLLPAFAPDSPLSKSVEDAFAPIREALDALKARLDRLEGGGRGAP
jgi:hypothetical protein